MSLSPLKVVRSGLCIGCGSCAGQTDQTEAVIDFDKHGKLRPYGTDEWFKAPSETLERTCPFSPKARNEDELAQELFPQARKHNTAGRFTKAYVGHVAEEEFRRRGSSGGMTSWVLEELMKKGKIDAAIHVAPSSSPDRYYEYTVSCSPEEIRKGARSRYYPVDLSEALRTIRRVPARYAIVGVPCFIKAIQLLRREDPILRERIVHTLGLFCGHMKSATFVESLALQMDVLPSKVKQPDFRIKDETRSASTYTAELTLKDHTTRKRDWWNLVDGDWGSGFWQYEACNYCDDVIAETADISFGDAWVEPYSSDGKGTNVVVVRSPELETLLEEAIQEGRLSLKEVDEDFVVETQAAGFRQRREGLGYRLTWLRTRLKPLRPRKRVKPQRPDSLRRRVIYRTRAWITRGSHRIFRFARALRTPRLFLGWGKAATAFYHGFAYSRGRLGALLDRWSVK